MITKFAIALLLTAMPFQRTEEGQLSWSANQRLSWNDFEGTPPLNNMNAALTSSSISIRYTTNGEQVYYTITCAFDKKRSWSRIKTDHILAHEQAHFDITEMYARKVHQALQAYQVREASVPADVNGIYQQLMEELGRMQGEFDRQTNFSMDTRRQEEWVLKIQQYLSLLSPYANYRKAVTGKADTSE